MTLLQKSPIEPASQSDPRGDAWVLALAGGGTGGHITPGLSLLKQYELQASDARPGSYLWFVARRGVEDAAFAGLDRELAGRVFRVGLRLEPEMGGAPTWGRLLRRCLPETRVARRALRDRRAAVLLGLGGFTSLPAVLAARSLGIPVALLEVNAVAGKATRMLAPLARRVFHAWPESAELESNPKHVHLGPPLDPLYQEEVSKEERASWLARQGLDPTKRFLLVLGGSQGALGLNRFLLQHAAGLLRRGVQIVHQVGPGRLEEARGAQPGYLPVDFLSDVRVALGAADLVLCRGGAMCVAEVAASRTPAIVVPYPHHPDRHQVKNARALGAGAWIVSESKLDASFALKLAELLSPEGEATLRGMQRELSHVQVFGASERLCHELAELAASHKRRT